MSLLQAEKKAPLRTKGNSPIVARRHSPSSPAPHLIKEFLVFGHAVRFRAKGTSMIPTIRDGEFITVCPVKPSDVRLRDIILYQNNSALIAHRVIRKQRAKSNIIFITRGDGLASCDSPVESQEILGKVISVERNGCRVGLCSKQAKMLCAARIITSRLKRRVCGAGARLRLIGIKSVKDTQRSQGDPTVRRNGGRQWRFTEPEGGCRK